LCVLFILEEGEGCVTKHDVIRSEALNEEKIPDLEHT
jgi:hypothetical protein